MWSWKHALSSGLTGIAIVSACAVGPLLMPWPIVVVDGDTVDRWPLRYRLAGFDAPEIVRAKCDAERSRGLLAKARLASLITQAGSVQLVPVRKRDPWGRVVARIEINGADVAATAIAEGWGVPYGHRHARRDWCSD